MKKEVLRLNQVGVFYDKIPVLHGLSMELYAGQLVAVVGPNGAGKSTLLKAILGLVKTASGSISVFGQPVAKSRNRIAYVPQCESVDWDFPITVFDLVMMGCFGRSRFRLWPSNREKKSVMEALERVGMQEFASRQISQLSCGQRQRAFLARALVQEADLYFLDEPFAGIDAGKTLLVVHHDLESVSRDFDAVILLNRQLIGYGPVKETFVKPLIDATYMSL